MDETLYDDKLSGEISKERYEEKHGQFVKQKTEIENQLTNIDASMGERLEQRLVILELSQKAADLYAKKTPEQKRLIISKLFDNLTLKGGAVSVKYSMFASAIADKVQKPVVFETGCVGFLLLCECAYAHYSWNFRGRNCIHRTWLAKCDSPPANYHDYLPSSRAILSPNMGPLGASWALYP